MLHTGVEANAYGNSKNEGEIVQILAVDPPLTVPICDNRYEPYVPCVLLRKGRMSDIVGKDSWAEGASTF